MAGSTVVHRDEEMAVSLAPRLQYKKDQITHLIAYLAAASMSRLTRGSLISFVAPVSLSPTPVKWEPTETS
jgi:hypothetical protein